MTGLEYVNSVLQKYAVNPSKATQYHKLFLPYITEWANGYLVDVKISGSSKKGILFKFRGNRYLIKTIKKFEKFS